jgi:hypothetical protein
LVLGIYDHDQDWSGEDEEEEKSPTGEPIPRLRKHHTQMYTNGSQCDLTGQLRATEIRVNIKYFDSRKNKTENHFSPYPRLRKKACNSAGLSYATAGY